MKKIILDKELTDEHLIDLHTDGKGYYTVLRPDWYSGRKSKRRVFYHHVVMCLHLGITQIPEGFVVHHIDFDKTNNEISNLALMTVSAHTKLHQVIRKLQAQNK